LLRIFDDIPVERAPGVQQKLDIAARSRTSLFPWRGQFSPEFIEFMLGQFAPSGGVVADPFVGSGTTLFEAARRSLNCVGAEINPAAAIMAGSVRFVNLSRAERTEIIRAGQALIASHLTISYKEGLFAALDQTCHEPGAGPEEALRAMIAEARNNAYIFSLIANSLLQFMDLPLQDEGGFHGAFRAHARLIEQLPCAGGRYDVFHTDARTLPLPDDHVDLVITSPPYINVFNYHQNHRPAMELLGWDALAIARSEFGSNRKNRGNRFLTVTQYALDMLQALREMRRVLKPDGRIILVVGRESNVRGIPFQNGRIVAALAAGGAGLRLQLRQERKFKNKFGMTIYEDILHLLPGPDLPRNPEALARGVAHHVLEEAYSTAEDEIRADIRAALEQIPAAQPSPVFTEQGNGQ
jgi:SAM-dependent methyltransferase